MRGHIIPSEHPDPARRGDSSRASLSKELAGRLDRDERDIRVTNVEGTRGEQDEVHSLEARRVQVAEERSRALLEREVLEHEIAWCVDPGAESIEEAIEH